MKPLFRIIGSAAVYMVFFLIYKYIILLTELPNTPFRAVLYQLITLGAVATFVIASTGAPSYRQSISISFKNYVLIFIGICLAASSTSGIAKALFDSSPISTEFPYKPIGIVSFFSIVIIAPVLEELIFRKFLFGQLRTLLHPAASIILTAVVFSGLHGSPKYAVSVLGMSLITTYIYYRLKSLPLVTLLHMTLNLLGWTFYHTGSGNTSDLSAHQSDIELAAQIFISAVFGGIAMYIVNRACTNIEVSFENL